jgi:predicted DNA-binding antitoxin AbrB/MazE fold protein
MTPRETDSALDLERMDETTQTYYAHGPAVDVRRALESGHPRERAYNHDRSQVMTAVHAIYEDGVFKPEGPVRLENKTRVELVIQKPATATATDDDDPTGWKTIDELIGCIKDGPEDGAENHDKYLYGPDRD